MAEKVLSLRTRAVTRLRVDPMRFAPSRRSLAVGGALILLALGLYGLARGTSMFAVRQIAIRGAPPPLAVDLRSFLGSYDGHSLVSLNAADVEERLDDLPTVRRAVVDRAFPHTLRVQVTPEVPVAVLRRGADSWLVSARGRIIESVVRGAAVQLPRIWLPVDTDLEVGGFLSNHSGVVAAHSLAIVGDSFPGRIAYVRAVDGQLMVTLRGGLEIRLGAPVALALKMAIAQGLVPGFASPAQGGPNYLDVSVPERPVAGRSLNSQVEVDSAPH